MDTKRFVGWVVAEKLVVTVRSSAADVTAVVPKVTDTFKFELAVGFNELSHGGSSSKVMASWTLWWSVLTTLSISFPMLSCLVLLHHFTYGTARTA